MMLTVVPAASAQTVEEDKTITFQGAGWGHGIGMSQWGAYGRAREGHLYRDILAAYYTGATIGTLGVDVPDPLWMFTNVASDITSTTLTVLDGPATPRTGMVVTRRTGGPSEPTVTLFTGDSITIVDDTPEDGARDGCTATLTVNGEVTAWPPGTCDFTVALTPQETEPSQLIQVSNCRPGTVNCTFGYGTGFHLVDNGSSQRSVPDRIGGVGLIFPGFDMVVETTLEEYVRGIAEVPFAWPIEALKTQVVAARSYAASFAVSLDHTGSDCFCDGRNTASFQVYAGWAGDRTNVDQWDRAVAETVGEIVFHDQAPHAQIVRAYYSSSNGGASESVKERWVQDLPYLVSVPDHWSLVEANWLRSWTLEYSEATVITAIWGTSDELIDYTLVSAEVTARNTSGSAKTVRFTAQSPDGLRISRDVSSGTVAHRFGLHSWYFDIDDSRLAPKPSGPTSIGVQDPRTGIWTIRHPDATTSNFYFGNPDDIPFIGDWNNDGIETVGLYRESLGFLFLRNSNDQGNAHIEIYYGNPDDLPIAGDWDGDGDDTIGIYRPSQARFYLRNTNTQGNADIDIAFGIAGDVPLAGDWDGDGVDTIGVYRPSTKMVYLTNSLISGQIDISFEYAGTAPGDRVLTGDWNHDGIDTIGVFRPSNGTFYLRDTFTQTEANIVIEFGNSWMNPIAGFWGP